MSEFPWLTVIGAVPLAGSIAVAALPRAREGLARSVGLVAALISLALTIAMASRFQPGGPRFQFVEQHPWIPQFGVTYSLGVDGIGLVLLGLAVLLVPLALLGAWKETSPATTSGTTKEYVALALLLETMVVGVFTATDVFMFYLLFEAMLVPMYFMVGRFGGPRRGYASVKFLLYSLFGGLVMLAAVIALSVLARQQGTDTFLFTDLVKLHLDPTAQKWLFVGFFLAFAVKAPMWPFHSWLPDAVSESRPTSAVLLVGLMDKAGTFGMIRYCLGLFPDGAHYFRIAIIVLAVVGVLYGALAATGQRDILRLIAYMSLSHFGLIILGIFAMTTQSQVGATFLMVNHGLAAAAILLLVGVLVAGRGSRNIGDYGGVYKVAPVLGGTFLVTCLAVLSLPGLATFASEFLVLIGTFSRFKVAAAFATLGIILTALYVLWMYQRTMGGPARPGMENVRDLSGRERWAIAPLLLLLIVLGLYPQPVLDVVTPPVQQTMNVLQVQDPQPAASAEGTSP